MERLGGRLWEVVSYGSRLTARAKCFVSQPRMEWYIYSKKNTESFLVFLLTKPLAILCDTHLRKCTFRNVPKTSDEQTLNFSN